MSNIKGNGLYILKLHSKVTFCNGSVLTPRLTISQDENLPLGSLFYTLHVYQTNGALWLTKQHLLNQTYLSIIKIMTICLP